MGGGGRRWEGGGSVQTCACVHLTTVWGAAWPGMPATIITAGSCRCWQPTYVQHVQTRISIYVTRSHPPDHSFPTKATCTPVMTAAMLLTAPAGRLQDSLAHSRMYVWRQQPGPYECPSWKQFHKVLPPPLPPRSHTLARTHA